MNVLIYGNEREKELLVQHMKSQANMAFRLVNYSHAEDYDTYLAMLREQEYNTVFVIADNAQGMEGSLQFRMYSLTHQLFGFPMIKIL